LKRKFARILGVGLTLALLTSLMVFAAPVSADVTPPGVTVSPATISKPAEYSVRFELGKELAGSHAGTFSLPNIDDEFTITENSVDGGSGTITVAAGKVDVVANGNALIDGAGTATITPADGAVPWTTADATGDTLVVTAAASDTTGSWTRITGTATAAETADLGDATVVTGGGAFDLPDVDDEFTITAAAADSGTITVTTGGVDVTVTGDATWADPDWDGGAGGGTVVVTATAAGTTGSWTRTGASTAAITNDDDLDNVDVGALAISGDTITLTFPEDTDVSDTPAATMVAAPGWIGGEWLEAKTDAVEFTGDPAKRTVTATLGTADQIGEGAQVRIKITDGITNPSAIDDYILTVATSQETTAVESAPYSIGKPIVTPLEGIVQVMNPAGILMYQDTGGGAIGEALGFVEADGYTVLIGPGTYDEEEENLLTTPAKINVTIKATGTPEETIIIADWLVGSAGATLDGLNIQGAVTVNVANAPPAAPVVIQNCLFTHTAGPYPAPVAGFIFNNNAGSYVSIQDNTFDTSSGSVKDQCIVVNAGASVTITGNNFTVDAGTTAAGDDDTAVQVSGAVAAFPGGLSFTNNVITDASGVGYKALNTGMQTIAENEFSGLQTAVMVDGADAVTVSGNLIQNGTVPLGTTAATAPAQVDIVSVASGGTVLIEGNDIQNNAGYSVTVRDDADLVTVIGNYFGGNTYGLQNLDIGTNLKAMLNYWGASTGPIHLTNLAGTGDKVSDYVSFKPFAATTVPDAATATLDTAGTIDRSTTVGISFTSTKACGDVTLARYSANPAISDPPYAALANAYYDVYAPSADGDITILFYNASIDADTDAYYYSILSQSWTRCDTQAVAGNLAYVIVTVKTTTSPAVSDLGGTPFVLVTVPPSPTVTITSPDIGAYDIPIDPMFTWDVVPTALRYELTLSEDPTFAIIEWSYNVDANFYKATDSLRYSTTYYWRVRALTGEPYQVGPSWVTPSGPWSTGIFTTEAEPVEAAEEGPTEITVETPTVTVTPGDVNVDVVPVVPDYLLWTIVGIGAVLIIALIVLIVRTRRVA